MAPFVGDDVGANSNLSGIDVGELLLVELDGPERSTGEPVNDHSIDIILILLLNSFTNFAANLNLTIKFCRCHP